MSPWTSSSGFVVVLDAVKLQTEGHVAGLVAQRMKRKHESNLKRWEEVAGKPEEERDWQSQVYLWVSEAGSGRGHSEVASVCEQKLQTAEVS